MTGAPARRTGVTSRMIGAPARRTRAMTWWIETGVIDKYRSRIGEWGMGRRRRRR
uniref:Uncharacterized protein n=1 Tax=Arundo donax TaxID=35708 RepID=A0A0A8Z2U1_ARUDO